MPPPSPPQVPCSWPCAVPQGRAYDMRRPFTHTGLWCACRPLGPAPKRRFVGYAAQARDPPEAWVLPMGTGHPPCTSSPPAPPHGPGRPGPIGTVWGTPRRQIRQRCPTAKGGPDGGGHGPSRTGRGHQPPPSLLRLAAGLRGCVCVCMCALEGGEVPPPPPPGRPAYALPLSP